MPNIAEERVYLRECKGVALLIIDGQDGGQKVEGTAAMYVRVWNCSHSYHEDVKVYVGAQDGHLCLIPQIVFRCNIIIYQQIQQIPKPTSR